LLDLSAIDSGENDNYMARKPGAAVAITSTSHLKYEVAS